MPDTNVPEILRQGATQPWTERLPLPATAQMTPEQQAAAQALIDSPRKAVFGPFIPLMQSPKLLDRIAKVGEYLRFESVLDARVRELCTCATARHVGNQFEWHTHAPMAVKAGVDAGVIDALRQGARPTAGLQADEELALDFTQELLRTNGVSDLTYGRARQQFGEQGVVELASLVGYFAMINWVMNVARTPARESAGAPMPGFPL